MVNTAVLDQNPAAPLEDPVMRAAVYRHKNKVVLEAVPVPRIGDGELLVRVHSCGVCGTDIK